jgi:hypothetical protein
LCGVGTLSRRGSAALTGLRLHNLGIAKVTASRSHKPPLPRRLHQMSPNNSRLPDRLIRSAFRSACGDGCWRAVYFAGQDVSTASRPPSLSPEIFDVGRKICQRPVNYVAEPALRAAMPACLSLGLVGKSASTALDACQPGFTISARIFGGELVNPPRCNLTANAAVSVIAHARKHGWTTVPSNMAMAEVQDDKADSIENR